MTIVLIFLAFVVVLIVLVRLMLTSQSQQRKYKAEQDDSLPPLTAVANASLTKLNDDFQQSDADNPLPVQELAAQGEVPAISPSKNESQSSENLVAGPASGPKSLGAQSIRAEDEVGTNTNERMPANDNWQKQCSRLKKAGQLDHALEVCLSALPLMTAFTQATTVLREQIRQAEKSQENFEPLLVQLYKLSAMADLLHALPQQNSDPGLAGLAEQTKQSAQSLKEKFALFEDFTPDYQRLGYSHLRLLKKYDISHIVAKWGQPKHHSHPFFCYQELWRSAFGSSTPSPSPKD